MDEQIFEALVEEFYLESQERIQRLEELLMSWPDADAGARAELLIVAKRELHTIKGNSGMMGLRDLQKLSHDLEDRVETLDGGEEVPSLLIDLDQMRRRLLADCGKTDAETVLETDSEESVSPTAVGPVGVRVAFGTLDNLVDLLSELVIFRNRFSETLGRRLDSLPSGLRNSAGWHEVQEAHQVLEKTLDRVQQSVMQLRMVPLEALFSQLKRLVFDEAERQGREVEFRTHGGGTPLDKGLLELASEALGHLVRNAVVHGLESEEERLGAGKAPRGSLEVRAHAGSDEVVIEVFDDGRGIDAERLRQGAEAMGHEVTEVTDLPTLLALPGLSTREETDQSAGRGMGMAAVMESIRRGGGQLEISSALGRGTHFRLRLPLSAAIVRALLLEVDDDSYVLPTSTVREAVTLRPGDRNLVHGAAVLRWRGELIPLVDLGLQFGSSDRPREMGQVLFVESEGRYRGLVADGIVGIRDIVVKPLDRLMGTPAGLAGSTILGDGRVVLILDVAALTLGVQRQN